MAIVTPCSTWDHDVAPDAFVVLVVVGPLPVDVDPLEVPSSPLAVELADGDGVDSDADDAAGVPAPLGVPDCDPPVPESELFDEASLDVDDVDGVALATPGEVT